MLMSPMTRFRVTNDGVPTPLNADYYAQRACAGLIISEYSYVEPLGRSAARSAGLYTDSQIAAWRFVTDAVHHAGGRIFVQLGHGGRITHPELQPDGALPIAPSPLPLRKRIRLAESATEGVRFGDPVTPRAMTSEDIAAIPRTFAAAAERACAAGFDGVELHAGSGFLHHQFLSRSVNRRTDAYGGTTENRCRLVIETLEAMSSVRGPGRVGVKIAPNFAYNDITEEPADIEALCRTLGELLTPLGLAYVHVQYPPWGLFSGTPGFDPIPLVREHYRGTLIAAGEFDRHRGEEALRDGLADFIAFGRRFLANPDLPERFRRNAGENTWDEATLYTASAAGLTDYPTLAESAGTVHAP